MNGKNTTCKPFFHRCCYQQVAGLATKLSADGSKEEPEIQRTSQLLHGHEYPGTHGGRTKYVYRDMCGVVTMLDGWKLPKGITFEIYQMIPPEIEQLLSPCEFGGHFRRRASPRCPHCKQELSPIRAGRWI